MTRASELTRLLSISANYFDCNEERKHINGQQHALRVASLATRHDPSDAEMIFTALVHDLGKPLSEPHHGEVIAEIVRDLVSEKRYQVLRTHAHYQAVHAFDVDYDLDLNAPWHEDAMKMCAWEIASFEKRNLRLMEFSEAIWYINMFCGDRP
jgi:hypothetical protein